MATLDPGDFPFTIEALREDNNEVVWGLTVLKAASDGPVEVYVPPLAKDEGVPIIVRTTTGEGVVVETGPYS